MVREAPRASPPLKKERKYVMFTEIKQDIVKSLENTLKLTREYNDLNSIVYFKEDKYANQSSISEYVIITYNNGTKALATVTGNSGSATVKEIIKNMFNYEAYDSLKRKMAKYKEFPIEEPIAEVSLDGDNYIPVTKVTVSEIQDLYLR